MHLITEIVPCRSCERVGFHISPELKECLCPFDGGGGESATYPATCDRVAYEITRTNTHGQRVLVCNVGHWEVSELTISNDDDNSGTCNKIHTINSLLLICTSRLKDFRTVCQVHPKSQAPLQYICIFPSIFMDSDRIVGGVE